jgi:hypothetical protein
MRTTGKVSSKKSQALSPISRMTTLLLSVLLLAFCLGCAQAANFASAPAAKVSDTSQTPPLLEPQASQIGYNSSLSLQASGGVEPYQFTQIQGTGGTLSVDSNGLGVSFLSPSSNETIIIQIQDANGNTSTAQIIVQGTQSSTGSLQGNVTNSLDGTSLAGVLVTVYSGTTSIGTGITDQNGNYTISGFAPGSYTVNFSKSGFVGINGVPATISVGQVTSINESLSTVLTSGQIRIVMTWCAPKGGAVRDMDSYLSVPGYSMPIGYRNLSEGGAELDHDMQNWYGPETITINNVASGTYTYYANNYSDRQNQQALGNSNVHVNVYQGSALIKSYDVPPGNGITYEVFQIVNGSIVDVTAYNDSLFHW